MKQEILTIALNSLKQFLDLNWEVKGKNKTRLALLYDSQAWEFNVEIKTKIVPSQIIHLEEKLHSSLPLLVIARYISMPSKKILKKKKISYIDGAGNAFIVGENLLLFIETEKTNRKNSQYSGNRAFNKAGLKVVYQFLKQPDYINKPYRFIGEKSTVTIDTVGKVIKGLLKEKYIVLENDRLYKYVDRERLFQEWVNAYNDFLRPKLKTTNYKPLQKLEKLKEEELPKGALWGGDIAAEHLTNYLIPQKALIYTDRPFEEIMKKMKLIPDKKGKVVIKEKFWVNEKEKKYADPLLVYADLIGEGSPRHIETANKIYQKYVKNTL